MKKTVDCIAPELLLQMKAEGRAILIIDVRCRDEFDTQHIPGAIHLPLADLQKQAEVFNKETLYVTACGIGGGRSSQAAQTLTKMGFDSAWLCGGTFGWFAPDRCTQDG